MQLPRNLPWPQADTQWASILNPVIANPLLSGQQINGIVLTTNIPNTVYHSLGQFPQGWFVVDINSGIVPFRTQWTHNTITLEAAANCKISIWIY